MLVISQLRVDPRVEREARALARSGYHVKVIFPDAYPPHHAEQPIDWGPGVSFRPLPPETGEYIFEFPGLFGDAMYEAAIAEKPLAYHCHDLTTGLVGLSAAARRNAWCVCDFHEWWSENVSWNYEINGWAPHPPREKSMFRFAERVIMRHADAVVTVCESIARELEQEFPVHRSPVKVVRNIPPLSRVSSRSYPPLREELRLPQDAFILLWQGGVGPSRHIEPIIEALQHSPRTVFVIRGPAIEQFGEAYRAHAHRFAVEDRLVLLAPVPSADVVVAAMSADAGIWTLPRLSKNFYYALPNKVFEYLASGLPILGADYPEVRRIVRRYGVGLCFDPDDPKSIAAQLNRMIDEPALVKRFRTNIPAALADMGADREWDRLVEIYNNFAASRAA